MDTTKPHGFFLASFLVLVFLRDLTEACKCERTSLHEACCKHEFVMRAEFKNVMLDPESPSYMNINKFSIQPIEIYKGPEKLRSAQFLYSPESQSFCGYLHRGPFKEEYLISGSINENRPQIKLCNFAKPWNKISDIQKKKLNSVAGKDCSTICAEL